MFGSVPDVVLQELELEIYKIPPFYPEKNRQSADVTLLLMRKNSNVADCIFTWSFFLS
jgi:hypothetical protein